MANIYETRLIEEIQRINNFPYEDIKSLDKYPLDISKQVLKVLIEYACQGQDDGPIIFVRKKINEVNKAWLKQYFIEVARMCIDYSDEWEYRRLMELVVCVIPELKQEVLKLGIQSENEEVRERVRYYQNNKYCSECLYYNGNIRPTHDKNTNIIEQCGKKYFEEKGRKHHVKHGKSKNVICAFEFDYHYSIFLLVGEYHRFERVQITKEEYESFYEWEGDALKVNEIKDRKLGCDACRNPAMISPEICLEKIDSSMVKQANLWKCKECGTLWEYGVYSNEIVDQSYAEHYYNVDSKTD